MGLHTASDRGGDPDEEKEENLHYPEAPAKGPPHTAEEPIKYLSAGQDFQFQHIRRTVGRQLTGCWTKLEICATQASVF
ncbi:hypothetical protein AN641_04245 [Candidatus Epulonipiscioides gigas]|nr:hypothetical protein AN641_04245 [Epulopiscium sp. SCG-C07WGA-EpuloA2]